MTDYEYKQIVEYSDLGPDPFIAPIVSDSDYEIKPYEAESFPKWKNLLVKVALILGWVLMISLSVLVRGI